jgi:hypothetical protein
MPPEPAKRDGPLDAGAEIVAGATGRQKRRVDVLDVDAAVLRRLDIVGDLDQLARGDIRDRRMDSARRISCGGVSLLLPLPVRVAQAQRRYFFKV